MASMAIAEKPHAVCIPYPAQGHINPMLKLAKLLHYRGFHITFVNTEFNHQRLLKSRGPDSLNGLPDFQFRTIPDGLPPSDVDATQDIPSLCESTSKTCLAPFRNLISHLNGTSSSNFPPVSCIVSDGVMTFSLKVAEELSIPEILFWTTSACGFLGYAHYCHLIERGLTPLKDESYLTNGYLDTIIDWVPGMKDVRLRDFPSFIRTTDPSDLMLNFLKDEAERASKACAIIFNTFEALEYDVLDGLSSMFPPIYTIGPLPLLQEQISDNRLKKIGSNLWKEETGCLEWLNSKEPNSVVYVNFGSITVMTPQQMIEFAWGLANSKKTFLWIIRPDLVVGDEAMLPPEFVTETEERGMLASWCQQEQVLKHKSIGGFLTHSGWNSTLESICCGVPMICWPFFAEQQTNCRYVCKEWGIGMEIDNNVKREEVEMLVRELMEGEKGKEMKNKAMEWKKIAEAASKPVGSSHLNLDKVINEVLLSKNKLINYEISSSHVLESCPLYVDGSSLGIRTGAGPFGSIGDWWTSWVVLSLPKDRKKWVLNLLASLAWSILKARNQGVSPEPLRSICQAEHLAIEASAGQSAHAGVVVGVEDSWKCPSSWHPPPFPWVQINVNGTSTHGGRVVGSGGIARDSRGCILGGFRLALYGGSPLVAEVRAIRFALQLAPTQGWRQVVVLLDALALVEVISRLHSAVPWEIGVVIDDIRELVMQATDFRILFTPQLANAYAHRLVAFGVGLWACSCFDLVFLGPV
ncbi:hypothetical protein HHK36_031799 [Tetracentron sinense]|uniref:UDP-glycosyltransferases domain-containing protein n=1 Tax=Tetracentron sinense TaxID=13715 RepID=A0A834YBV9_TETSI|nr:hypothetical protein HHK36_031799 [Tetracentron sinense]